MKLHVPRVVAHRGGRGADCPDENTLPAFQHAYDGGARAIELDVRPCASGEIVVMHDDTLERMTGGRDTRKIASIVWTELRDIRLALGAVTPLLDDVLAWARDRGVVVNVELKHDVPRRLPFARKTAAIVDRSRAAVVLSSFDPWTLACASAASKAPRAILTYADEGVRGEALLSVARRPIVDAAHIERTQASSALVRRLVNRGVTVGVWTVNDATEARDLLTVGASYIVTDRPVEIAEAIGEA